MSIPARPSARPKILFVAHEASRTGAPVWLLNFQRWLRRHADRDFDVLLARGGPLETEFAGVAPLLRPSELAADPTRLRSYALVYSNTICNGGLLGELAVPDLPIVTHVHELEGGWQWTGARNMAAVLRQSHRFVACANVVAERLRTHFDIPAERISVHPEMIDVPAVTAGVAGLPVTALRREAGVPADAQVLVGCGTVNLRKGPDLFVQLAARLKGRLGSARPLRCLWIGGPNSGELARALEGDVRKLGLEREFVFIAERASPQRLMALGDLFCLPSREDPFPLVMLEAAALGKPVVCFDGAGGGAEFCALGAGVTAPYLDVGAMADICGALLVDGARRSAIGARAAEVVRERFTVDTVAPALWREIERMLGAAGRRASRDRPPGSLVESYDSWPAGRRLWPDYFAAHGARRQSRQQARALALAGRRADAVRLLIRAATTDIGTKNPEVIFESLVEIGDDLAELEPRQSAWLLAQAEKLSAQSTLFRMGAYRAGPNDLPPVRSPG